MHLYNYIPYTLLNGALDSARIYIYISILYIHIQTYYKYSLGETVLVRVYFTELKPQ